jgi:hypothetical protein
MRKFRRYRKRLGPELPLGSLSSDFPSPFVAASEVATGLPSEMLYRFKLDRSSLRLGVPIGVGGGIDLVHS